VEDEALSCQQVPQKNEADIGVIDDGIAELPA
jgi:hypothetical protein